MDIRTGKAPKRSIGTILFTANYALSCFMLISLMVVSGSPLSMASEKRHSPAKPTLKLRTTIKGNVEQPNVLYILPWQAPETDLKSFGEFEPTLDKLIRSINRETFIDEIERGYLRK